MKRLITYWVKKRNPNFELDPGLNTYAILQFLGQVVVMMLRANRLWLFGRNPKRAMLGKGVRFFNLPKITWGAYLKLGDQVKVSGLGKEGVQFGNNVSIGDYSRIIVSTTLQDSGTFIELGDNVGIGEYAYLGGAGGLSIGSDCIVGQYFSCHPENHIYDNINKKIRLQGVRRQGIAIGENCWIGSKVTILDGVEIGSGSIIAAGAVVTKAFPENSIIGGGPAKLINQRKEKHEDYTSYRLCS